MQYCTLEDKKLLIAIIADNLLKVEELIQQGVDVNQVDMANDVFTPLMLADVSDRDRKRRIVKLLIDACANLHDSTYVEDSPLGLAVTKGNLKIV